MQFSTTILPNNIFCPKLGVGGRPSAWEILGLLLHLNISNWGFFSNIYYFLKNHIHNYTGTENAFQMLSNYCRWTEILLEMTNFRLMWHDLAIGRSSLAIQIMIWYKFVSEIVTVVWGNYVNGIYFSGLNSASFSQNYAVKRAAWSKKCDSIHHCHCTKLLFVDKSHLFHWLCFKVIKRISARNIRRNFVFLRQLHFELAC